MSVFAALCLASTAGAAPSRTWSTVRGVNGDPDLVLDLGRDLSRYPLHRVRGSSRSVPPQPLSAVEKVRLDARRIARASSLGPVEALDRFVNIARAQFPCTGAAGNEACTCEARYAKVNGQAGTARLSRYVERHVGVCREKAFLVSAMLREMGVRHRVRYGLLYDHQGRPASDRHAWVEAQVGAQAWLLDPSFANVALPLNRAAMSEELPGGAVRNVRGIVTPDFFYAPDAQPTIMR